MSSLAVRRIGRLVTCDPSHEGALGVIENAALTAEAGVVTWVGHDADVAKDRAFDHVLDADGAAVLPGLVDCHTHLVFAGDRASEFAARMRGEPYHAGGIGFTKAATRAASDEALTDAARARLSTFLGFGVTTVEAKSGYGLNPEQERRLLHVAATVGHRVEVVRTFLGAHVVPAEYEDDPDGYVDLVCEAMMPGIGRYAEFADVWVDDGAFTVAQARKVLRAAKIEGIGIKVHAEQLGRSGGAALAAEFGAVSADHLEFATEDDADALARSNTVAVLLPGASMMTRGRLAPARMLIERGVTVAVSTDFNPGTSYSENLPMAASLACGLLGLTVEEAILGITRHAAAALARRQTHGVLKPGSRADLVVLHAGHEADLIYHYGSDVIATVVKDGVVCG